MKELDPDFLIDLGDVTMAEKLTESDEEILYRSNLERSYWDDISGSVPFFMVLGNNTKCQQKSFMPMIQRQVL